MPLPLSVSQHLLGGGCHQFQNVLGHWLGVHLQSISSWVQERCFQFLGSLDKNSEDFFLLLHLNVKGFVKCHFTSSLICFGLRYNGPKLWVLGEEGPSFYPRAKVIQFGSR